MYIKHKDWSIQKNFWEFKNFISQSEYDKAQVVYTDHVKVPITKKEKQEQHIYRTNEQWEQEIVATKVVEVDVDTWEFQTLRVEKTYNPYEWYTIIPDDAVVLTEEEYQAEIKQFTFAQ